MRARRSLWRRTAGIWSRSMDQGEAICSATAAIGIEKSQQMCEQYGMLDIVLYVICISVGLIGIPLLIQRLRKYPILLFAFIPLIFAIIAILRKPREEAIGWVMCVVLALGVIGLEPYTSRLLDRAFGPVMRLPYSGKIAIVACALILGAVSLATFTRSVMG